MKTQVWCTTSFIAWHMWLQAPLHVDYLKHLHRHVFHVKATVKVAHDNRDVEFITLKREVDEYISKTQKQWGNTWSCEMAALMIGRELANLKYHVVSVEVSEDGENGAIVVW